MSLKNRKFCWKCFSAPIKIYQNNSIQIAKDAYLAISQLLRRFNLAYYLFSAFKRTSEDPIAILSIMTYGLMKLKWVKYILYIAFWAHVFSLIVFLTAYFSSLDVHFLMEYGSTLGIQVFVSRLVQKKQLFFSLSDNKGMSTHQSMIEKSMQFLLCSIRDQTCTILLTHRSIIPRLDC